MNPLNGCIFLSFVLFQLMRGNEGRPPSSSQDLEVSLACGAVLHGSYGEIRYKKAFIMNAQERCSWLIHSQQADYYEVEISMGTGNGTRDLHSYVSITGIGRNAVHFYYPITSKESNAVKLTLDYTILLVTLSSDAATTILSRGFSMSYKAYWHNESKVKGNSTLGQEKAFLAPPGCAVKYPVAGETKYANNDLAVFLFPLENGLFVSQKKYSIMYRKREGGLYAENNYDCLRAYKFQNHRWGTWKSVCGNDGDTDFRTEDLAFMVFETDSFGQGKGFSLASEAISINGQK